MDNKDQAKQIKVLPGYLHIRKRAAMYIGDTDVSGLRALFTMMAGWAFGEADTRISVIFNNNGSVSLGHDGNAIPVRKHPKVDRTILELLLTELACGPGAIDLPVITALSEKLTVETEGCSMEFARGQRVSDLLQLSTFERGARITYKPDPEIFGDATLDIEAAKEEIYAIGLGHPSVSISVSEE